MVARKLELSRGRGTACASLTVTLPAATLACDPSPSVSFVRPPTLLSCSGMPSAG